jgi:hypothetical protein
MLRVSASSARIFSSIAGKKTRQTRGYVDQAAAQIILQNYLDSRALLKTKVRAGGLLHELALVNLREFFEARSDRIGGLEFHSLPRRYRPPFRRTS